MNIYIEYNINKKLNIDSLFDKNSPKIKIITSNGSVFTRETIDDPAVAAAIIPFMFDNGDDAGNVILKINEKILPDRKIMFFVCMPYEQLDFFKGEYLKACGVTSIITNPRQLEIICQCLSMQGKLLPKSVIGLNEKCIISKFPFVGPDNDIIADILIASGFSKEFLGFEYIEGAMMILLQNYTAWKNLKNNVYGILAKNYKTNIPAVEKNIRTSIAKAWEDYAVNAIPEHNVLFNGFFARPSAKKLLQKLENVVKKQINNK